MASALSDYFEDDIQLNDRLVINAGLRYELCWRDASEWPCEEQKAPLRRRSWGDAHPGDAKGHVT